MTDLAPVEATPIIQLDLDKAAVATREELQVMIASLEAELMKLPQVELPIKHHFSKDVYAREMHMHKGMLVVGKIHKHTNLNILSAGEVSVISVDGVFRAKAPFTLVSQPGAKRVIYAHEDVVWTTIHGTAETDLDKIEDQFIAKNYGDVVRLESQPKEALWHG